MDGSIASDHLPVILTINEVPNYNNLHRITRYSNINNTSLQKFKTHLDNNLKSTRGNDRSLTDFQYHISIAAKYAFTETHISDSYTHFQH